MFDKYNKIVYPIATDDQTNTVVYKTLADITTNIRVEPDLIDEFVNYDQRILVDGETPEITSNELYDDPNYHYSVMIVNDRFDWRNDFPLTAGELQSYIRDKYADPNGVHHFEDPYGNVVDNTFQSDDDANGQQFSYPKNVIPITNSEYETRLNEQKRSIKVVRPQFISTVKTIVETNLQ